MYTFLDLNVEKLTYTNGVSYLIKFMCEVIRACFIKQTEIVSDTIFQNFSEET